jgi:hypothetical protein
VSFHGRPLHAVATIAIMGGSQLESGDLPHRFVHVARKNCVSCVQLLSASGDGDMRSGT